MSKPYKQTSMPGSYAFICFGGFAILVAIGSSLFVYFAGFYDVFGFSPFVGPLLFAIIGIGVIIGGIVSVTRAKSGKIGQFDHIDNQHLMEPYTESGGLSVEKGYDEPYSYDLDYGKVSDSLKQLVDWKKITPLIYKGKLITMNCPVCKLEIKQTDFILECPGCKSLFHGEHFVDWLINNDQCPVCFAKVEVQ
jgi:hypothetical protein